MAGSRLADGIRGCKATAQVRWLGQTPNIAAARTRGAPDS